MKHRCQHESHDPGHVHGPRCGHDRVRHDNHWDYQVGDHLHHVERDGSCSDHGPARPEGRSRA